MAFLHLFIINKSGGLIYNRELSSKAPLIDVNVLLSIGSTFHSLCSIAVEACPVKKGGGGNGGNVEDGIEIVEGDGLVLCCFQTLTGVKFVITAEPGTRGLKQILKQIYVLYADCTLKDPFYELEMPIRCDLFTQAVEDLIQNFDESMYYYGGSGGDGTGTLRSNDAIVTMR